MQTEAPGRLIRRVIWTVIAVWLLAWELRVLLAPELELGPLFSRFAHDGVLAAASALCLWAGIASPNGRERRAWIVIGAGVAAWTFGEIYYTAVLWTAEEVPIPSPADGGFLFFPPLVLVGVLMLVRSRTRDVPGTLWADGVTAALAVSAASAALVFETVQEAASGQAIEIAVNLAYPIADLLLLGLIVGALAGTGWQLDRTWVLLASGVAAFWLADSLYLVRTANGTYESGNWFEIGWWLGLVLIAAAGWQPVRRTQALALDERLRRIVVPIVFGAGGLGLLVYGSIAGLNVVAVALAAASLVAVMVRSMLTFRDNIAMLRASRVEASTDALTGLGNRRALARELERELPRASQKDPLVLVLFDLDGFKLYNDTFGHPAGDALLVRLGDGLASFVRGSRHRLPHGRGRVLRPAAPGLARGDAADRRRGRGALRAWRRLRDRLLVRCDPPARRGRRLRRRAADRRPADVRAEERRPHVGHAPVQGRAAPRARRARARHGSGRRRRDRRPGGGDRARAAPHLGGHRAGPPRHRAARRRQGGHARRDPRQARAARGRRVGVHPPAHDHRRADHRRGARADPRGRASCVRATSAGTAAAIPTRSPATRSPSAPGSSPSSTPTPR